LVSGAVLCFVPLHLMSNVLGALLVGTVIFLTHRRNQFFNATPSQ